MKLNTRMQRLEQRVVDPGCPACRDRRGRHVLVNAKRLPDGTVTHEDDKPKPCEKCGEVPEQIIEIVRVVVETRADLARIRAEGW